MEKNWIGMKKTWIGNQTEMNRKWLATQAHNFIYYPFINNFFGDLWSTPFPNWFGAWN